jgi:hypothetical protein
MNWILITPHQGLGDHILCNGIYREYAKKNRRVFITVKNQYYRELSRMLMDLDNVYFLIMPNRRSWTTTRIIQLVARLLKIRVVGLGSYGDNFFPVGVRFDNNFYDQAKVKFSCRWSSFIVSRNISKENELYELLGCNLSKYIFLHEDISRNFIINRNKLPKGMKIITPSADSQIFDIFDYRKVIECANEIHVIESAFSAFIESLELSVAIYAHRYARPHALNDFRHEFTYKKPWEVLTT